MTRPYDVIVVGARCAGSPTAMLLARKGYRVLLADRAAFPSDTVSTHIMHPLGAAALARWGLLDRLVATGCPPIATYVFDFGPFALEGSPGTRAFPVAYCPRRTILDKLLVDAAKEAGAEVREGFEIDHILIEDGRVVGVESSAGDRSIRERATVVIGADGRTSIVANAVKPPTYDERPALLSLYYAYWSGIPMHGRFESYDRSGRGFAVAETHDGLTMIIVGRPASELAAIKADVEGSYLGTLARAPALAERVRAGRRETGFVGAMTPNYFRKPYGPGWALVGDAGYMKDPVTGQGITDAFRDAERCVLALDQALSGVRPYEAAMADYRRDRDAASKPMYDLTCEIAKFEPPSAELRELLTRSIGDQRAMDRFVQVNAGTLPPSALFAT